MKLNRGTSPGSVYRRLGKRAIDVSASSLALVALAPLMGVLAMLVRWRLGSPVFYRQERPGLHGDPFELRKFRSMTEVRDGSGHLLADADRLTPLGMWLRKTSLDELPELWNVVRGDMGLVGPRPLLIEYLPLYSQGQARRHEVRPGLTGWAQIHGRNAITWEERFARDVWYVDNLSMRLDLLILRRTVRSVFRKEGINSSESATMNPFTGN